MITRISDGNDIMTLRKALGLNQAEMANKMGLSSRAYFTLEQEPGSVNLRHIMLAEIVALQSAVERSDRSLAPANVAALADKFAKLKK